MSKATSTVQVSIRLPGDMVEALRKIADVLERDPVWVISRAVRQYLDTEGANILQEAEALAALDRGEGIDFDRVLDEADQLIARARLMKTD